VWPGGLITDVPRGTTAGDVLKARGVITIDGGSFSSSAASSQEEEGDEDGEDEGGDSNNGARGRGELLVNVNNRLVSEETVLQDGDLVILARERLNI
jgi:hypothetical protein